MLGGGEAQWKPKRRILGTSTAIEDGALGRGDDLAPTTSMVRLPRIPRQLWSVKIDTLEITRGVA